MKFIILMVIMLFASNMIVSAETLSSTFQKSIHHEQELINLNFKRISARELLQFLAEAMGVNLIMSDNVSGFVSLHLTKVTWQQAFDSVLEMHGWAKKKCRHFIFVATPGEFALREKLLSEAAAMEVSEISLHHIDANVAESLVKSQSALLSQNAKLAVNQINNALWVKESNSNIVNIKKYINQIDKSEQQILIAAKIINIDHAKIQELGLRFVDKNSPTIFNKLEFSLPSLSLKGLQLAIASAAEKQLLNLQLDALEACGHSTTVADPKIITQNHKLAVIESGEEIPYQESTASGATNVAFKKAVLSLKVKPSVLPDGRIILDLEINQNKVASFAVNGVPAIQTQELKTEVVIRNGQTVILGGIFEKAVAKKTKSIPLVSSIPILGRILSYHQDDIQHKQLLIFISPQVLADS